MSTIGTDQVSLSEAGHWHGVSLGEVHCARSLPDGEAVHIQVGVLPHWDYPVRCPGDGVNTAGRGAGENAYVLVHVQPPVVMVGVALLVEAVVVIAAVAVVVAAAAVVALTVAEEHAGVQARNAGPRRALCLLRNAKWREESQTLRARE